MRKILSVLILVSVLLGSFSFTAGAGYHPYTPGDINGSGEINAVDVFELKKHIVGMDSDMDELASELTNDGVVNARDLLKLKNHIVGNIDLNEEFGISDETVGKITIAGRNIAEYTIVVTNPENANMTFAASELQRYVEKASGIELDIAEGESDAAYKITLLEDMGDTLGTDGFSITVRDGQLTIMGGALRGTMYGVYELIEEYIGYRFYGYYESELFEADAVNVDEGLTDTQIPDSRYRDNKVSPYKDIDVYYSVIKRKLNGASVDNASYGYGVNRTGPHAHSFDYYANEDYFAVGSGKFRHCLSDFNMYYSDEDDGEEDGIIQKSTYQLVLENMCALLDARIASGQEIGKQITEVSCSYASSLTYCTCYDRKTGTGCRETSKAEGSYAGPLVDFVNKIEEEISAKYPGVRVITNAYSQIRVPPKTKTLNDNVVLLYCWNGCVNHSIENCECESDGLIEDKSGGANYPAMLGSNKTEKAYYLGWMEHCSQAYIWYYPTNIYYSLAPLSNTFKIYDDMRWFMENKAVGFYVVGTSNDAFDDMNAYLISEMMWDKDITREEYDKMIGEYLAYHYGPGWENIYQYLKMLEEAGNSMGCYMTEFSHPLEMYSGKYFAEHFEEMLALFEAAAMEANDDQLENIRRTVAHLYFLGLESLYDSHYTNGSESEREDYAEAYRSWYDLVNEEGIRVTYERIGISADFDVTKSPCELVYGFRDPIK